MHDLRQYAAPDPAEKAAYSACRELRERKAQPCTERPRSGQEDGPDLLHWL
jgi:hypothetical protein